MADLRAVQPAYSAEAEQSTLGAVLNDNAVFPRVAALLAPSSFYLDEHGAIFGAMQAMHRAGQPMDAITVFEHLRAADKANEDTLAYLNSLQSSVLSARHAVDYAGIVRDRALQREQDAAMGEVLRIAAETGLPAAQRSERIAAVLARIDKATRAAEPPFRALPLADLLGQAKPEPQAWAWQNYVPLNLLTVIGAHGGVGKSVMSLQLAVCAATGRPLFGRATRRCRVAFFSAEDGAELLMHRLLWVCTGMGIDPGELEGQLHVLDATEGDPALFREVQVAGQRIGTTTAMHGDLAAYMELHQIDLLIVDNMSDTFDGNEVERAKVRAFLRSLLQLRRDRQLTVVLLVHVDKATARGLQSGTDGYSGSTATNNTARSRLFMAREKDGALRVEHQKCNVGPLQPPLVLRWPEGGLPELDAPVNGYVAAVARSAEVRALLRLIDEFTARGEYVSTSLNSPTAASRLLAGEPGYPRDRRPAEVQALLRDAERDRLLTRETYRTADRKERERWAVTDAGRVACR